MGERELWDETVDFIRRLDEKQEQDELRALARQLYPYIREMLTDDRRREGL